MKVNAEKRRNRVSSNYVLRAYRFLRTALTAAFVMVLLRISAFGNIVLEDRSDALGIQASPRLEVAWADIDGDGYADL